MTAFYAEDADDEPMCWDPDEPEPWSSEAAFAVAMPGDCIIVRLHDTTTAEQAQAVRDAMRQRVPNGIEVLVLGNVQDVVVARDGKGF